MATDIPSDPHWRNRLIDALNKLNAATTPIGRNALVAGIQTGLNRDHTNAWADLTLIVDQLITGEDVDGLRIVIRNALASRPSPKARTELEDLQRALKPRDSDEHHRHDQVDLRPLRAVLAVLYDTRGKASIVASDILLNTSMIDLAGPIGVVWHEILKEAHHQEKLDALVRRALSDYGANTALRAAAATAGVTP